jgi:hypothetical protein
MQGVGGGTIVPVLGAPLELPLQELVPEGLTRNVNFPTVRITPMNSGQALAGPQPGLNVSMIMPRKVPVHHAPPPSGMSFTLTRCPLRRAPALAKPVETQPVCALVLALTSYWRRPPAMPPVVRCAAVNDTLKCVRGCPSRG